MPIEDRGHGRARERDQVEDRDDHPERDRVGNAHRQQHDRRQPAGYQADEQVARHVAADGAVDVVADLAPPGLRLRRQRREEPLHPGRPLEQHEERHEDDRDRGHDDRDHALGDGDRDARKPEHLRRAAVPDRVLDPFLDVVLRLEEAEASAAVGEVVRVVGQLVHELVGLVDERRDEREADPDEEPDRQHVRQRSRIPAARDPVPLEPVHGRVEREREEGRDHDPREDVPRDPDHLERERDGDHDPEHGQDRPGPKADEAFRDHADQHRERAGRLGPFATE